MDKSFVLFFIIGLTIVAAQRSTFAQRARIPFRSDKACRGEFDCRDPEECVKGECVVVPIKCRWPGKPDFGGLNPDWPQYEINAEVRFTCQPGYRLIGNPRSKCTAEGLWNSRVPRCVSQRCSNPGRPTRGLIIPDKQWYLLGEKVQVSCKSYYRITGSTLTTCKEDGTWSHALPTCHKPNEN